MFAEYLNEGVAIPESLIDYDLMHSRYAALLWDYEKQKNEKGIFSDNEASQGPNR